MDKLYEKIDFVDDSTPALSATNLNAISKALDDIDDRVISGYANAIIAGTAATQCQAYAESASASASSASGSASSASASASAAASSASEAASTVSDLSEQFQDCIDKIDELLGEEVTANG